MGHGIALLRILCALDMNIWDKKMLFVEKLAVVLRLWEDLDKGYFLHFGSLLCGSPVWPAIRGCNPNLSRLLRTEGEMPHQFDFRTLTLRDIMIVPCDENRRKTIEKRSENRRNSTFFQLVANLYGNRRKTNEERLRETKQSGFPHFEAQPVRCPVSLISRLRLKYYRQRVFHLLMESV